MSALHVLHWTVVVCICYLALTYVLYLLLAVVLMACLHVLVPVRRIIPAPYRYLGLMAVAAGVLLVVSVAAMFRRAGTTIRPFETSSVLVVRGPYRFTRNPMLRSFFCASSKLRPETSGS